MMSVARPERMEAIPPGTSLTAAPAVDRPTRHDDVALRSSVNHPLARRTPTRKPFARRPSRWTGVPTRSSASSRAPRRSTSTNLEPMTLDRCITRLEIATTWARSNDATATLATRGPCGDGRPPGRAVARKRIGGRPAARTATRRPRRGSSRPRTPALRRGLAGRPACEARRACPVRGDLSPAVEMLQPRPGPRRKHRHEARAGRSASRPPEAVDRCVNRVTPPLREGPVARNSPPSTTRRRAARVDACGVEDQRGDRPALAKREKTSCSHTPAGTHRTKRLRKALGTPWAAGVSRHPQRVASDRGLGPMALRRQGSALEGGVGSRLDPRPGRHGEGRTRSTAMCAPRSARSAGTGPDAPGADAVGIAWRPSLERGRSAGREARLADARGRALRGRPAPLDAGHGLGRPTRKAQALPLGWRPARVQGRRRSRGRGRPEKRAPPTVAADRKRRLRTAGRQGASHGWLRPQAGRPAVAPRRRSRRPPRGRSRRRRGRSGRANGRGRPGQGFPEAGAPGLAEDGRPTLTPPGAGRADGGLGALRPAKGGKGRRAGDGDVLAGETVGPRRRS